MNKLRVGTRLAWMIALSSLLLVAIGLLGLHGIAATSDALGRVYEQNLIPSAQLGTIRARQLEIQYEIVRGLVAGNSDGAEGAHAAVAKIVPEVAIAWNAFRSNALSDDELRLADAFTAARDAFETRAVRPMMEALRTNNQLEARRLLEEEMPALWAGADRALTALIALQQGAARHEYEGAVSRFSAIRVWAVVAVVSGLAVCGVFGALLARGIVSELGAEPRDAARVAQRVAAGNLSAEIVLSAHDRDSLMAHLKTMQGSLATLVVAVREGAERVAAASLQIAQGNQDLSSRTEQQASALEQTAASMQELGATVRQNAENARQANRFALGASDVARKGGEVVGQVVQTMKSINDSSKQISHIIAVIDGIAFQTNILALNAAVEAARAGEQGRGFAVVAGEVRSLAQRSAEAAKEIKGLITTSVDRVGQGTALVDQAGETMQEIVTSIRRVTDIMGEISAASAEQSSGVAQIGDAVSQMDRVTQQNAALVEQSAAAADSLTQQANRLVDAVAAFRVAADAGSTGGQLRPR